MFVPKLFSMWKDYSLKQFSTDAVSGVVVGIVALPLAIAFAIASGVSPERGLITAVVAGLLISALGGSRVQIGGPTGAFVVIVYGIIQKYGYEGLQVVTIMAGIMLIIMGLARFGSAIKFIPYPVTVGFTSGIAAIIFISQIKDFCGLKMGNLPSEFIPKMQAYQAHMGSINPHALMLGCLALLIVVFWHKLSKRIPGSLIAILVCTAIVAVFQWPVETIGSRFGEIPHSLPKPAFPRITWSALSDFFPPALTVALLAGIESLLSAVVADGMIGGKHRSNMEIIAQGIANIASPLFGGIPATGAIARTATNINNGGRTPIAGIIHAIVLLLIMLLFGKWVTYIPMPALAAILIVVAYNMSEWRSFGMLLKSPRSDVAVLLVTFGLTVLVDLTVAIQYGVVLSAFLFMRRMALVTNVGVITREFKDEAESDDPNAINKKDVPAGVVVYEVNGPFFFGASFKFRESMNEIGQVPQVMIIRMRNVPCIDATGLHVIKRQYMDSKKMGVGFVISGIHAQPYSVLDQSGFLQEIGAENVCYHIDAALERAREILAQKESVK